MRRLPVLVELSEPMAREAIAAGAGRRALARRGVADQLVLGLGVTGSLISVVQAPQAIRAFASWVASWVEREDEIVLLHVGRGPDGRLLAEIAPGVDPQEIIRLMQALLDERGAGGTGDAEPSEDDRAGGGDGDGSPDEDD